MATGIGKIQPGHRYLIASQARQVIDHYLHFGLRSQRDVACTAYLGLDHSVRVPRNKVESTCPTPHKLHTFYTPDSQLAANMPCTEANAVP